MICWSCNPTKFLSEGEYLHTKNKVEVEQEEEEFVEPVNKDEVRSIIRPRPNSKFLGTRLPQWLYFSAIDNNDTNAIERVMLNSFAKPPNLLDSSLINESEEKIKNYLFGKGYFDSNVESTIEVRNKKSTATFHLDPGYQHIYGEYGFDDLDSVKNSRDIVESVELSEYITTGQNYDVQDFQNIRTAIVNNALERGYYKFGKSSVYIEPDTLNNDGRVDISVVLENTTDSTFNQPFYVRNIYMKTGRGSLDSYQEPVSYNGKLFSSSKTAEVNPKILDRFILLDKDSLYSRSQHLNTINKLIDLPIISYANIEFTQKRENDTLYLDALINANARSLMSVRAEPTLSEFGGPAISAELGFEHRNLFQGAEHFQFTVGGGFESAQTQDGATRVFGTSYIQTEPKITFPRLLLLDKIYPQTYENTTNQSTSVAARFGYQDRRGLYQLFETSFGQTWDWQSSVHNRHTLSLVDIALLKTANISDYYQSILDIYPSNAYNLENRFILGSRYIYTYSNKLKRPEKNYYNFKGTVESAGNLAYALFGNAEDTLSIGDVAIARYVRGIVDYQYNFRITDRSNFVTRVSGGVAYPIGAVESIPAVKQFYAGGSNSMRAWRARSLGPGTYDYRNDSTFSPDQLVDQRGDVKLEANAEYRFPFTELFGQTLEGAIFTDAGNIWSLNEPSGDDGRDGAEFSDDFLSQIAIGSGVGLRLKIQNFLNIRADMAWKLRDPILAEDERWVEEPFTWNNSNITVGIGYPFFN